MRYISLFSGIEAASCAWEPLGWEPMAFAEIDEFPSAVLAHRWPDVPNLGDVSKVDWSKYRGAADVVVGGFPCFPADTLVLTDCGLTPIQDIKVGDMVLTHKGRYRKVVRTGSSVSDTVILKGQGSSGLECTPNHPFLSCKREYVWNNDRRSYDSYLGNTSWVHASDMAGKMWLNMSASLVEMKIPQFRMRGEESDFEYDESFFYFVGRWLGDGWVVATKRKNRGNSIQKRVHVCCAHELADDLQARLDETGLHFCRAEEPTVTKFVCVSAPLYDWLVSNFGKGAGGKHLPSWVFGMPIEYREALFLGYIDSDGTPVKSGVGITSISKALTVGMKILAAGIGYTSSVVHVSNAREKCVIEGRTVNERPYFNQTYYSHSRSAVLCDSGFWGRVRKVLPGSRAVTVYNLEVEGDNSYTADGIAVHNCQSYSIAGLRQGLADPRGQLMLEFLRACSEIEPEWIVGENVPGLLSADGGRAFETFLNAVAILWPRGGVAWRVLDSQFVRVPDRDSNGRITGWFGPVAQRRRRVFLVINTRDWRRAAAVLLEPEGMCGNSKASGKKREELAADARRRAEVGGGRLTSFKWFQGSAAGTMPAYDDGTTPTLVNADGHVPAIAQDTESVAFAQNQRGEVRYIGGTGDHVATIAAQTSPKGRGRSMICQAVKSDDDPKCVGFVGNYGGKTAMGVSEEVSPTVIAKHPVDVLCMAHGQANAEIEEGGVSPTLTLLHEAPIVVREPDP